MSDKIFLKDITLPIIETGEDETYSFVQTDPDLEMEGDAADAKKTGDKISELKADFTQLDGKIAATQITNTASGAIASFPDGADGVPVKDLTVQIEPVQDLHGQANPYPGGASANQLAPAPAETKTDHGITVVSDGNGKYTLSGTATGGSANITFTLPENYTIKDGDYLHMFNSVASGNAVITLIYADSGSSAPSMSPVNRIMSLMDVVGKTITSIKFYIASGASYSATVQPMICQSSTAVSFAPYSNICPISGWTGANVSRTGVNLYDATTYPLKDGWYINRNTGAPAQNASYDCTDGYVPVGGLHGQTIKWNCPDHGGSNPGLVFYDKNKHYISGARIFPAVVPTNAEYLRFTVAHGQTNIMLYVGDDPSTYEPYHGNTYPITFPTEAGTVYGGTLDVTSGVLTVTWGGWVIDGVNLDVSNLRQVDADSDYTNIRGKYLVRLADLPDDVNYNTDYKMCSHFPWYKYSQRKTAIPDSVLFNSGTRQVDWVSNTFTTLEEFHNYLVAQDQAGTPVMLACELGTPQTYQLTPQEVSTLLGLNNIWADCGDTTVDYRADTKLYIEKLTAPTEDDMVANTNIPSDTYFMIGNTLFLSTTTIPAGDVINPGTNCTQMSLASALNALNS